MLLALYVLLNVAMITGMYLFVGGMVVILYGVLWGPPYDRHRLYLFTALLWPIAIPYTVITLSWGGIKGAWCALLEYRQRYVFPKAKVYARNKTGIRDLEVQDRKRSDEVPEVGWSW